LEITLFGDSYRLVFAMHTVPAEIDENGSVNSLHKDESISETALLSEPALADDWNRPEEDVAWSHLRPAQ